jgi:hypothetical protein
MVPGSYENDKISKKILKQSRLVEEIFDMASEIILHKHLHTADESEILTYSKSSGKIVPPDFKYWPTVYGSGAEEN